MAAEEGEDGRGQGRRSRRKISRPSLGSKWPEMMDRWYGGWWLDLLRPLVKRAHYGRATL